MKLLKHIKIVSPGIVFFEGIRHYVATGDMDEVGNYSSVVVDYRGKPSRANQEAKFGDVIFARMAATVKVREITKDDEKLIFSTGFCVLRPDKSKVESRYLYHYLKTHYFQRIKDSLCTGATQKAIANDKLEEIEFPLPHIDVQRNVAAILDKADAIRRKRQESIRLTEEFLRSVFLDMFGDPVTNPKGWVLRKFADVGTLDRGVSKNRPRNAPELLGGPYPLIQTGDVANSDGYIRSYKSTYSDIGLRQSKMWHTGTLCITIAANIAKTGILTFDACFPDSMVGFIPNRLTTTEYVKYWLSFLQKSLEDNAPESAQKNINLDILRKLNIPVPDIELQKEFTKRVKTTQDIKSKFASASAQQTQLFESLSQRAFRGEL